MAGVRQEMLTMERVDRRNAARFVAYAIAYGPEHDTSFLPDPGFEPSPAQPSYLLVRDGEDVGAASLLLTPRYTAARRVRFALLHSRLGSPPAYQILLETVRSHLTGMKSAYLFIPDTLPDTAAILAGLGFRIERYSFALVLETLPEGPPKLPAGLRVVSVQPDDPLRLRQFADTVNRNFGPHAGHLDLTIEDLKSWFHEATYLEDGIGLLLEGNNPVGSYTVTREYQDRAAGEVGGLSVNPEHRGKGIGRLLLRHAVGIAASRGLHPVFLSVNAENDAALRLYLAEGFRRTETVICYTLDLA